MTAIGKSVPRVDAHGKVTGETLYPGDINLPNQAYLKILFAGRPHAIIKRIDTENAAASRGVLAVLTAKDVAINGYGLIYPDQPVLCGPGSSRRFADRVRFIGDQVAVVIAESEELATRATKLIKVDYEDLPLLTDPIEAMKNDSLLIHPDREDNILRHNKIRKGDVEAGFSQADVIIEAEYKTPVQEHAYLQPEAGLGYIDEEGRITVQVAGQWTHEDQEAIALALNLPIHRVRIIYPAIGGAFGGREDMSVQIILALAAIKLHERGIDRPVKIIWSREESIVGHHKRHAFIFRSKWGATNDGKITAAEVEVIQDGGAYACTSTKVLGNATLMCVGPYEIANVSVDAYSVYTNNLPGGAFRGFGGPQAAFAAECQINKLAHALGIDPVEMRMRNLLRDGSLTAVGTPLPEVVTIDRVVAASAEMAGWEKGPEGWSSPPAESLGSPAEKYLKRGIGIACGFKNIGFSFGHPEKCTTSIELLGGSEIERVIVYQAGADVGQGAHTVIAQMTADAVGVPLEMVEMVLSDTAKTEDSGSASASRLTYMTGNSIRGAAAEALMHWRAEDRPAKATFTYTPSATTDFDSSTGYSTPNFAYGYVSEVATVEVDMETGHVRLLKVICADDVGKAINMQQIVGQIEGGIVQAAGYALMENFIQENGQVATQHLSTYLIPTVLDIPEEVESVVLEFAEPNGPWGVRGMAEMPYIPLAPVVVAALHDATGIWFDEFPLIPERVLLKLQEEKGT
ncbi:MAG: xanthine dehydrogenase family protein [Chloroflexi bacterium]|nr:xanthine dehydrogenase family protein [Chloroflexota bacterium]